jgi:hypothetical protein
MLIKLHEKAKNKLTTASVVFCRQTSYTKSNKVGGYFMLNINMSLHKEIFRLHCCGAIMGL